MIYNSFYTIKELDYKTIESRFSHENISVDLKKDIEKLIADHKAIIEYRKKIFEQQNAPAIALFNLFEDPVLQPDLNNPPSPLDNQPDNSMQIQSENKEEDKNPLIQNQKKRENGGKKKLPLGNIVNHSLSEEEKKCAGCGNKMHKQRSKTKTYVLSLPLLSSETHISESCRCLSCDTQATATRSDNLAQEYIGRYHFSAISALASLRYQRGMASYRMETMSDVLGIKSADSTQWSLFEHAASLVQPFICFLEKEVANAPLQHTDDTHNIITLL